MDKLKRRCQGYDRRCVYVRAYITNNHPLSVLVQVGMLYWERVKIKFLLEIIEKWREENLHVGKLSLNKLNKYPYSNYHDRPLKVISFSVKMYLLQHLFLVVLILQFFFLPPSSAKIYILPQTQSSSQRLYTRC